MAKPKGWHREDIKAELRKRFGSVTVLSLQWGYSRAAISHALMGGHRRSAKVERRIADALGLHPHTLWPDRWSPEGEPLHLPRGPKPSPAARTPHRHFEEAA